MDHSDTHLPREHAEWASATVAGVSIVATDMDTVVEALISQNALERVATPVRLVNAWSIVCGHDQADYLEVLNGPGLNLPDGRPVATRLARSLPSARQIRGPSLFRATLDKGRESHTRHYFLGGTEQSLAALVVAVQREYPGAEVAGTFAPPFAAVDTRFVDRCLAAIHGSNAQLIWVSLGTPKQDFVAASLARVLGIPVIGIGAAFDFVAKTVAEAPVWIRAIHLEWAFRLLTEPRRLWRRYLIGNVRFLRLAIRK